MLKTSIITCCAAISVGLALPGCEMKTTAAESTGSEFVVTCMGSAWDVGPCTTIAMGRCKGRDAELRGALTSTYLPVNGLYQTTARYRCR